MVTKWSAAFMAFPWSTGCAWSLQWKENMELMLEKGPSPIFPSHQVRCRVKREALCSSWGLLFFLFSFFCIYISEASRCERRGCREGQMRHRWLAEAASGSSWKKRKKMGKKVLLRSNNMILNFLFLLSQIRKDVTTTLLLAKRWVQIQ